MEHCLGFDLGGTKCAAVLGKCGEGGMIPLGRAALPTNLDMPAAGFIEELCGLAEGLMASHGVSAGSLCRIGVSCGGPLDSARGLILSPPNLPGWDNVPVVDLLQARFGVEARLQNDANACALAEWQYGAAKGCRHVIFLTFGTGMGAGLLLNGRLYDGACGMAGEVGHVRLCGHGPVGYGKQGSFEGFCSGGGLAQLARTMVLERLQMGEPVAFCRSVGDLAGLTARTVGDAAEAGDPLAREIYAACGRQLGAGLSLLIDVLNPEIIVIGSVFARREGLLREAAMEVIGRETLAQSRAACRIVPAALGDAIGDWAALAVATYEGQ